MREGNAVTSFKATANFFAVIASLRHFTFVRNSIATATTDCHNKVHAKTQPNGSNALKGGHNKTC